MSDNVKKNIVVAAAVVVAISSVVIAILLFSDIKPVPVDATVRNSTSKSDTDEKTNNKLRPVSTTRESTTEVTTNRYVPPVIDYTESTRVIAPGLNETDEGFIQMSDDLRYSINIFLNNFVEADLESFSYRPSDEQLVRFALSFNFINKRENFERLDSPAQINGREYNYRISKSLVKESIENYFLVNVNGDFGEDIINYKDGYFYWQFTGAMLYDQIAVVTAVEHTGNNYYRITFNLYNNYGSNKELYRHSDAQLQALADSSDAISFKGTGTALVQAQDIYNYGTYYLYAYDVQ